MHNPGNFRGVSNQKAAGISSTFTDTMVPEIGMVDIESEWTAQDREQGGVRGTDSDFPPPRLAPKTGARTWGTGRGGTVFTSALMDSHPLRGAKDEVPGRNRY